MSDGDLDKSVAVLRALLTSDFDTHRRLDAELPKTANPAFAVLLGAAMIEAAERHFGENSSPADVINFVAEARVRYSTVAKRVSTESAEQVIRAALGEDRLFEDMSGRAIGSAQTTMLYALVQEEGLTSDQVDALLARASEQAGAYLRRRGAQ